MKEDYVGAIQSSGVAGSLIMDSVVGVVTCTDPEYISERVMVFGQA